MIVTHSFGNKKIKKSIKENISFLLSNKIGSYCYFSTGPKSRYNGVFFYEKQKMFKVIENIQLTNAPVKLMFSTMAVLLSLELINSMGTWHFLRIARSFIFFVKISISFNIKLRSSTVMAVLVLINLKIERSYLCILIVRY